MPQTLTGASAIRSTLAALMAEDERIVLLGDSVGRSGGVAGTTQGLLQRFGETRVLDLPVADRATLGFAVGLTLGGKIPVVELTSTGRLPAVAEVLAESGAIARCAEFAVPLVVRVPYGTEAQGLDRPIGDLLPEDVTVACPADPGQAAGLLRTALGGQRPILLLEPRAMYASRGPVGDGPAPLRARVLREGGDVTLAAWGVGVAAALTAAEELAREGTSAEVVDVVTLAPLDRDALGASLRKTGRLVVVHPGDARLADQMRRIGLDEGFLYLESPMAGASEDAADVARVARGALRY